MAKVSIVAVDNYQPERIRDAMKTVITSIGPIEQFVDSEKATVIKPNLLMPKPVASAVSTHPEIIRQCAGMINDQTGLPPVITDSPGVGTARAVTKRLGLDESSYFTVENATEKTRVSVTSPHLSYLNLSRTIVESPSVWNIAKAKTHGQMIITAAVKNTFGAIVGLEKAQWHYNIGKDPKEFARLVVNVHQAVAPRINILDAVIGMEGNGPGSGTPRPLGFIAASTNAHALDYVLCKIWDVNPNSIFTLQVAREEGLLPPDDQIEVVGDPIDNFRLSRPWKMATQRGIPLLKGPQWMTSILEHTIRTRPVVDHERCTLCMECKRQCAAEAIAVDDARISFDYERCISCFCCQEMCPYGAITVKSGIVAQLLGMG